MNAESQNGSCKNPLAMLRPMLALRVALLTAASLCLQNLQCQTRAELSFTNKFATFTNLQGETFIGAELIEADSRHIVFKTNDIFGAVDLTNLSFDTLQNLGVTQSARQSLLAADARSAQAVIAQRALLKDEQQKLNDPSNLISLTVESIQTSDYDPNYGQLQFCKVKLASGAETSLFVARLPASVQSFFEQKATLAQRIDDLTKSINTGTDQVAVRAAQIKQAQYQNDMAMANPAHGVYTGDDTSDTAVLNTVIAINNKTSSDAVNIRYANQSLDDSRDQIIEWKAQLAAAQAGMQVLMNKESVSLSVSALLSHYLHNRFQIMVCAPQQGGISTDSR